MRSSRREFIRSGVVLAAAAGMTGGGRRAEAIEPLKPSTGGRLKLSVCAYSYREQLQGKDAANPMTLDDYLRVAQECGCDGVEPTSYYFPDPLSDAFVADLKAKAHRMGLDVSGTAIRSDYCVEDKDKLQVHIDHTKKWVDYAAIMGAPAIRVFAGGDAKGDIPAQRKRCVEALKPCLDYAAAKGVFLAVENHGGIVSDADQLLALVEEVASPWFAITLDSGNFHTADPYGDFARCVPYAVTVQVKTEIAPAGKERQETDMAHVISILRDGGYSGYIALEYEGKEPAPEAVPRWLKQMRKAIDATQ